MSQITLLESQQHLNKQQVVEKEGAIYEDDVIRRESMVNIKDYLMDVKQNTYGRKFTEDTEESNDKDEMEQLDQGNLSYMP